MIVKSMSSSGRALILMAMMAWPVSANACTICFGAPGSKDTQALSLAILALLGVLAVVLGSIVAFIVHLARQAKNAEAVSFSAVRDATGASSATH